MTPEEERAIFPLNRWDIQPRFIDMFFAAKNLPGGKIAAMRTVRHDMGLPTSYSLERFHNLYALIEKLGFDRELFDKQMDALRAKAAKAALEQIARGQYYAVEFVNSDEVVYTVVMYRTNADIKKYGKWSLHTLDHTQFARWAHRNPTMAPRSSPAKIDVFVPVVAREKSYLLKDGAFLPIDSLQDRADADLDADADYLKAETRLLTGQGEEEEEEEEAKEADAASRKKKKPKAKEKSKKRDDDDDDDAVVVGKLAFCRMIAKDGSGYRTCDMYMSPIIRTKASVDAFFRAWLMVGAGVNYTQSSVVAYNVDRPAELKVDLPPNEGCILYAVDENDINSTRALVHTNVPPIKAVAARNEQMYSQSNPFYPAAAAAASSFPAAAAGYSSYPAAAGYPPVRTNSATPLMGFGEIDTPMAQAQARFRMAGKLAPY